MISFEIAKSLKEAGLDWRPQKGDFYYTPYREHYDHFDLNQVFRVSNSGHDYIQVNNGEAIESNRGWYEARYAKARVVFAPGLEQILAEGDRRGYVIEIITICFGENLVPSHQAIVKRWENGLEEMTTIEYQSSFDDKRSEAAAKALLWILGQGK